MKIVEFREALREAMSEEMRRDDKIFLMGEEVAEYNGAWFCGHCHWRIDEWFTPHCGVYDI
jgi:hypothetical protein